MFLTLEDPNAKIKGSRDSLGLQPIWARFARHVVSNLTMQTTSVRGFTTLLLGRYFGARLIEEGRVPPEAALDVFLRMEQLAAYARHVAHGVQGEIRGVERVRAHLQEQRGRVHIEADRRGYILGDQKVTGLWGLYSVAARVSGWIDAGPVGIRPVARAFVEAHYLPRLEAVRAPLTQLLARGGRLQARVGEPLIDAVASVLPNAFSAAEVAFYGEHLRDGLHVGGAAPGRQQRFRSLLEAETDLDAPLDRAEALRLVEAAEPVDPDLSHRLRRIVALESALAPADALFDFVLTRHGQTPAAIAQTLRAHWGAAVPNLDPGVFRALIPEVAEAATAEIAAEVDHCQGALARGDYALAVRAVLAWNAAVMRERSAGPWVVLDAGGRLDVRYRGAEQALPDANALSTLWRHPYFVDSLKRITRQLGSAA
ncbi:MAG: hypothetical protein H6982_06395 [Chromatiales bacterium]|nr:hypothetical protein [Chromatiales bacterium]